MPRSYLHRANARIGRTAAATLALCAALMPATLPAQTRAGTVIANTATLHDGDRAIASNAVAIVVAERLDIALVPDPAAASAGMAAVTLTNRGNGDEAFVVAARRTDNGEAVPVAIAGPDGTPGSPIDVRTPVLAPGAAVKLLVPLAAGATITLSARAATGSGTPGTAFDGQGDGGGDALVGATGASATVTLAPAPSDAALPTLAKSQAVTAPDGSATAVGGARVAYTLVARFAVATADASIVDPIPAGTAYLPGSLNLDGASLADAGHLDGGRIVVPLGAVAAGGVRTLRFTVVIS